MSILDNALIEKYFGCECNYEGHGEKWCRRIKAENVLAAMEAEIKPGNRVLRVSDMGPGWVEDTCSTRLHLFHPFSLRLDDRWQGEKEVEYEDLVCRTCGTNSFIKCECRCHAKPDPIETKIAEIHPACRDEELKNCDILPLLRELCGIT